MDAGHTADPESARARSELFVVRVWQERLGDGRREWRGKVQHALSGDTRYFREWSALAETIRQMLADAGQDAS